MNVSIEPQDCEYVVRPLFRQGRDSDSVVTMTYQIGMREQGWEIVNTFSRGLATFGGLPMEHLTIEEAHLMKGLIEAYDRGMAAERSRDRLARRGIPVETDAAVGAS